MKKLKLAVPSTTFTTEYDVNALPHQHAQWEFVLFPSGSFLNRVNDVDIETQANFVMVLGPMHSHTLLHQRPGSKHRDLYISDAELKNILQILDMKLYSRLCRKTEPLMFPLPANTMQTISEDMKLVESLQSVGRYTPVLRQIAYSTIVYLLGLAVKQEYFSENDIPKAVLDFLDLLQIPENLQKSLSELVAKSGYSYSYFSVLFQKYTDHTLHDYFLQAKLNRAVSLLSSTHLSILDIAYEIGYDSVSAFIAKFKEFYNCTPLAYRKRH